MNMGPFADWHELCDFRAKYGDPPAVNVYYLDYDPVEAARAHCDLHVKTGLRDAAMLLSSAWHAAAPVQVAFDYWTPDPKLRARLPLDGAGYHFLGSRRIYGPHHVDCALAGWVRSTQGNYEWLWDLANALVDEHKLRFKKETQLAGVVDTLKRIPPLPRGGHTQPEPEVPEPLCVMNGEYYDTVASYRRLYLEAKRALLQWTRRRPPGWVASR